MNLVTDGKLAETAVERQRSPMGMPLTLLDRLPNPQALDLAAPDAGTVLEVMLPQLRTLALLIATRRMNWSGVSPSRFADEADWLAARILLLGVTEAELPLDKLTTLDTANQRALEFAKVHGHRCHRAVPALITRGRDGVLRVRAAALDATALRHPDLIMRSRLVAAACLDRLPETLRRLVG